jgi:hypothetical protein
MCGDYLDSNNRSDEHVFPRWLQSEFNLWNKTLVLLNGSEIQYKSLTIPCCKTCNNEHLNKKIEKKVETAVKLGYDAFIKLDEEIIFKWLIKISFGMLYKELSLKMELRNPISRKIIEPEELKEFNMLHTFLQTVRYDTHFIGRKPWSILVFRIKNIIDEKVYDAQDLILTHNYFMLLGNIGIVSNLQDNEVQKELFIEHMKEYLEIELHPIQFREICAKVHYKSYLMNKTPYYTIVMPEEGTEMTIVSNEMDGYVFDDWVMEEYARVLEWYWEPFGLSFEDIYKGDNAVLTFLNNEDGSIKIIE